MILLPHSLPQFGQGATAADSHRQQLSAQHAMSRTSALLRACRLPASKSISTSAVSLQNRQGWHWGLSCPPQGWQRGSFKQHAQGCLHHSFAARPHNARQITRRPHQHSKQPSCSLHSTQLQRQPVGCLAEHARASASAAAVAPAARPGDSQLAVLAPRLNDEQKAAAFSPVDRALLITAGAPDCAEHACDELIQQSACKRSSA